MPPFLVPKHPIIDRLQTKEVELTEPLTKPTLNVYSSLMPSEMKGKDCIHDDEVTPEIEAAANATWVISDSPALQKAIRDVMEKKIEWSLLETEYGKDDGWKIFKIVKPVEENKKDKKDKINELIREKFSKSGLNQELSEDKQLNALFKEFSLLYGTLNKYNNDEGISEESVQYEKKVDDVAKTVYRLLKETENDNDRRSKGKYSKLFDKSNIVKIDYRFKQQDNMMLIKELRKEQEKLVDQNKNNSTQRDKQQVYSNKNVVPLIAKLQKHNDKIDWAILESELFKKGELKVDKKLGDVGELLSELSKKYKSSGNKKYLEIQSAITECITTKLFDESIYIDRLNKYLLRLSEKINENKTKIDECNSIINNTNKLTVHRDQHIWHLLNKKESE